MGDGSPSAELGASSSGFGVFDKDVFVSGVVLGTLFGR